MLEDQISYYFAIVFMKQLKKIITAFTILLHDAFFFMKRLLVHLALPGRKRKGNLLYSLFVFFTGTVELLNRFEKEAFQMATVFKQKHVRKGIIAITAFLFLLSSIEWTYGKQDKIHSTNLCAEQLQATPSEKISLNERTAILSILKTKNVVSEIYFEPVFLLPGQSPDPSTVKRYLLIRSLLI